MVVASDRKLGRDDLQELREAATEAWERQRAFTRELEHDPMQEELHTSEREHTTTRDATHDYKDQSLEGGLER